MMMTARFASAHAVTGELAALGMTETEARQVAEDARAARDGVPTRYGRVLYVNQKHWEIAYAGIPAIPPAGRETAAGPGPRPTWTPGQAAAVLQSRVVPELDAWKALADALHATGDGDVTAGGVAVRRAGPGAYSLTLE